MLGYEFVYGNLFDRWLLLLAASPLLLFVGWHLMLLAMGGRPRAPQSSVPVYVMPEDLNWTPYTANPEIQYEIADAVLTAQMLQKDKSAEFAYDEYAKHLQTEEARRVARLIPSLHIYTAASVERALGMR